MNGRTCPNCGWVDLTASDDVWGLPGPADAVHPPPPADVGSPAPPPAPALRPPVPPPPPAWTGSAPTAPAAPVRPPSRRTAIAIAAVVAAVVLAIGAFVVFGGSDDDSASTRTDETRETEPATTESVTTQPDTTEPDTTPTSAAPDPSRDYPAGVRDNFLTSCVGAGTSTADTCLCILEDLETAYTLNEFAALEQTLDPNALPPEFAAIVAGCQP
jgi:hypothetical protein